MTREQIDKLDELLGDESDTMTRWEEGFIENLSKRDMTRPLSKKQAARLDEIWHRVFG